MTATASLPEPSTSRQPGRIRLIALALCSWHDYDPVACSRALAEPAQTTRPGGTSMSPRDRDALLLRLERDACEDEQPTGVRDDWNVRALDRKLRHRAHPFWRRLADAMTVLQVEDPVGVGLLVDVFVDPRDPRDAMARCHALSYAAGGTAHAVETPRYRLVRAIVALNQRLGDIDFPREIREQVEGWEEWLAAVRTRKSQDGRRVVRSDADGNALRQRDRFVRELSVMAGWSQQQIAAQLGLSQQMVSRILQAEQPPERA